MPVRQPRAKLVGLRGARAGLARSISLLASLKDEEDASLAAALAARRQALAQLRRLSAHRDRVAGELLMLESDAEEPLARELRELSDEHRDVCIELQDVEERLRALTRRKRQLEGRMEDVRNRREAGLSGYRGALREVEDQLADNLRRPPVRPLDERAFGTRSGGERGAGGDEDVAEMVSPGGAEFLRLRPDRRTIDMAREWWEREVEVLDRRKAEVDKEREALEEGAEVWRAAMKLVSDFEAELRAQMKAASASNDTQEEMLHKQVEKTAEVIKDLEQRLHLVEDKGWNLLICAIGAELEAFKEAEQMLHEALGLPTEQEPDLGEPTPRLSPTRANGQGEDGHLVDIYSDKAAESDNEVPADLLVSHDEEIQEPTREPEDRSRRGDGSTGHEDSENEIPPEFLVEHHREEDDAE